jgi:uncharacterized protein
VSESPCCQKPKKVTSSCCDNQNHATRTFDWLLWGSLAFVLSTYLIALLIPEWIQDISWLHTAAHTVHEMVNTMWWGVLIGIVFIGLLSVVPREFVLAILGKGGSFKGLLRATFAGVLLDLCSHGILMVASKLYERGASIGQVMAFLLASPWNSFSLTLILIALIGWQWTFAIIILSMVVAWCTGWVFDRLVTQQILPQNPHTFALAEDFDFTAEAKQGLQNVRFDTAFILQVMALGVRDSRMVLRWLLFGICLAAVLRMLLDAEQFAQYFGPTFVGLTVTITVATILEVCSEGSTPIAGDIFHRAGAPGNSFAFLMAGVATDYTEIMVIKDTTKSWKIALFLPLITLPQIIALAMLLNYIVV